MQPGNLLKLSVGIYDRPLVSGLTVDGTAEGISVTVNAYKHGIKAPGNWVIVLVLAGSTDVEGVMHLRVLQSETLTIRDVDLNLVKDRDGEKLEIDLACLLLNLVPGELRVVVLDDETGESVSEEGRAVSGDKLRKLDALHGGMASHLYTGARGLGCGVTVRTSWGMGMWDRGCASNCGHIRDRGDIARGILDGGRCIHEGE